MADRDALMADAQSVNYPQLALEAGRVFSPTAPIDERSLFAGRDPQIRQVVDAILQKGQHAILFGERGVGKTSLANVLSTFLSAPGALLILAPRVNCDGLDSFDSVWRKAFDQIDLQRQVQQAGFGRGPKSEVFTAAAAMLPDHSIPISPDHVRRGLTLLAQYATPIIIIDEFDRLPAEPKRAFADTIKTLSDHSVGATVVLVGVADSVDQLISEHQSVERALVQVRIPRMSPTEIRAIIEKGLERLGMSIAPSALHKISLLSQGLPHYTHLIGLYASRHALDRGKLRITEDIVESAIQIALNGAQQSVRSAWHRATSSPRKDNLFGDVLLACALAKSDDLGYFAAQDVREPIREITGKQYDIPSFSQHLNDFCEEKRGPILQRTGTKRRFRFRFVNPLMQPFVIMQGIADNRIKKNLLDKIQDTKS